MSDMNISHFTGRLTREPESKALANDCSVVNFALAVNENWTKDGEKKEKVIFVEFDAWNGNGKFVSEYCNKGDLLRVSGKYSPSTNADGKVFPRWKLTEVQKLSTVGKKDKEAKPVDDVEKPTAKRGRKAKVEDDDDIPF